MGYGKLYLSVGLSALQCIKAAVVHARREKPRTILDFPSGYGRFSSSPRPAYNLVRIPKILAEHRK
jgi:hypothetical protein